MPRLAGYSTLGKALFFSLPEGRFEWKSSESECCLSNTLEDEVGRQWWSKASRWGAGRLHSVSNVLLLRTTWQPLIHYPRRRIIEKGLCRADIGEQVANSYFHVFLFSYVLPLLKYKREGGLALFKSMYIRRWLLGKVRMNKRKGSETTWRHFYSQKQENKFSSKFCSENNLMYLWTHL